jgi:hypothetical protein
MDKQRNRRDSGAAIMDAIRGERRFRQRVTVRNPRTKWTSNRARQPIQFFFIRWSGLLRPRIQPGVRKAYTSLEALFRRGELCRLRVRLT